MKLIPRDEVKEVLLVIQEVWLVARLVASWVHLSSTPAASRAEHMKIQMGDKVGRWVAKLGDSKPPVKFMFTSDTPSIPFEHFSFLI